MHLLGGFGLLGGVLLLGFGLKVLQIVGIVLVRTLDEGSCVFGGDEVAVGNVVLGLDELNRLLLTHVQLQLLRIVQFGCWTDQAVLFVISGLVKLGLG